MTTMKIDDGTLVYYDGPLLMSGTSSDGHSYLISYIEGNIYLCAPVDDIDLHTVELHTVFKGSTHFIDVSGCEKDEDWDVIPMEPLESFPDDWLVGEGVTLYDFIGDE